MSVISQLTKGLGLSILAFLALAACNQTGAQTDRSTNAAPPAAVPTEKVSNNPNSASAPTISADDAADRVEDVLEQHSSLGVFDLDADDQGNAIVLTGQVQNQAQKDLAETVAKQAAPGFPIVNRITQ